MDFMLFRFFKRGVVVVIFLPVCFIFSPCRGQDPVLSLQAKVWSKDNSGKVHYSDWKDFTAVTVNMLKGFTFQPDSVSDEYGGWGPVVDASGFFHTRNENGRWWVMDPHGRKFFVAAVNSIRPLKSGVLAPAFHDTREWASITISALQQLGFNLAGSWSDTASIISYNRTAPKPFPYTTQLNLLSGYASVARKKDPSRKTHSVLSFILDPGFSDYCREQMKEVAYLKNDPNLFGHFSDNELPFTNKEINDIIDEKIADDKSYTALQRWSKDKGLDENALTGDQKREFIGYLAGLYYKIVGSAIHAADPRHMYIGSRLHSNAITNKFLFEAAADHVDIFSINYYGEWQPREDHVSDWAQWTPKPFFITEFYTKAEETGMANKSGAGWIVKTQRDRGIHYQNFCLQLLRAPSCVGWHWFRYQDNDPNEPGADDSNKDSNKGIVNIEYSFYQPLTDMMKELNNSKYHLIRYFDSMKK
jgi:hypothetical protein